MLLIGYGNPGREDDGLGPAFAERIAKRNLPGIDIDIDYQLSVDHALAIGSAELVVFADASIEAEQPFTFSPAEVGPVVNLSSHSVTPATALTLAQTLYGKMPQAFILGIAGYRFDEVREGLTPDATSNLDKAEAFFLDWLSERQRADAPIGVDSEPVC